MLPRRQPSFSASGVSPALNSDKPPPLFARSKSVQYVPQHRRPPPPLPLPSPPPLRQTSNQPCAGNIYLEDDDEDEDATADYEYPGIKLCSFRMRQTPRVL